MNISINTLHKGADDNNDNNNDNGGGRLTKSDEGFIWVAITCGFADPAHKYNCNKHRTAVLGTWRTVGSLWAFKCACRDSDETCDCKGTDQYIS